MTIPAHGRVDAYRCAAGTGPGDRGDAQEGGPEPAGAGGATGEGAELPGEDRDRAAARGSGGTGADLPGVWGGSECRDPQARAADR